MAEASPHRSGSLNFQSNGYALRADYQREDLKLSSAKCVCIFRSGFGSAFQRFVENRVMRITTFKKNGALLHPLPRTGIFSLLANSAMG